MGRPVPPRRGPGIEQNYVFRGSGRISEQAVERVGGIAGLLVVPVPPGMIVFGRVANPRSLPRIMRRLESLGMRLDSVHRVTELCEPRPRFSESASQTLAGARGIP